jgi:hypothetical protein
MNFNFKKNSINTIIWLAILFLFINPSCRKEPGINPESSKNEFIGIFNSFWIQMSQSYVFWDIEKTKWDEAYDAYSKQFAVLNVNDTNDIRKSVSLFRSISGELIDGHCTIRFTKSIIMDSIINPVQDRKKRTNSFYFPVNYLSVDTNYLDKGFIFKADNNFSLNGVPLTVVSGKINDSILYFSCSQFMTRRSFFSNTNKSVKPAIDFFFDGLDGNSKPFNKVIIDLRGNLGGDTEDLTFLFEKLYSNIQYYGYTQYKIGPNRFDYSPWLPVFIEGKRNSKLSQLKIIVLADRNSASLSEIVVQLVKSDVRNTFVGDTTYGATGVLLDNPLFSGGSFKVQDFMYVALSASRFKSINGILFEGKGIEPDFNITINSQQLALKKDLCLEKAISLLK